MNMSVSVPPTLDSWCSLMDSLVRASRICFSSALAISCANTRAHTPCSEKIKWPESVPSRSYQTRTSCPGRHFKPKEQETHSTRGSFGLLFWNLCCLNMQILPLPQWAWSCYTFLSGRSSFSWVSVQAPEKIPTETLVLTSALMLAMHWGEMFPRRTFRRSSGFFWSFRLEIRLRRRVLYFISVDLNSW